MGFIIAFFAIKLCCFNEFLADEPLTGPMLFVYAISVIFVPVMDVFRVFFARICDGRSPFYPDKRHIHHKFLALGYTMRQIRWIIFAMSFAFFAMNVSLSFIAMVNINVVIIADILAWILLNMLISSRVRRLQSQHNEIAESFVDVGKPKAWLKHIWKR